MERGPWGAYHRQCYQTYTHKKLLARLKKRRSEEGTSIPTSADEILDCTPKAGPASESGHYLLRKNLRSNQALNTDKRMCIICQKDKRNTRNHGRNEPLSVCTNLKDTLLKAAKLHQDDRIIMQLESVLDNVAADVLYHRSCYQAYTHPKEMRRLTDSLEEDHHSSPFQSAFQALVREIEETILNENGNGVHICRMPDLRNRFALFLTREGITDHTSYRTEKLKRRLRLHFGDRLTFYRPTGRSACIVHAANAPAYYHSPSLCQLNVCLRSQR